jgi:EAL domain-containing protein (putative c-di-GMP-specific phosphodiesterase class I)
MALYRAKELGRGRCVVFDETLARRARRRLDIEAELRIAIEQSQLICHYQPEIDLETGRMVGVEALVRWDHPVRGLLGPAEFIDVADESGLIVELGTTVVRQALQMAYRWRQHDPNFMVACNVSPRQLLDPALVDGIRDLLAAAGLPATALRLEVVETALIEPAARMRLAELRALGVSLAIDDFGTGYSSLSYLDRLEVDVLKVDQAFLEPIRTGEERLAVVEATLAMARSLGLHTVAEGVERPAQVALLRRLGCPAAQGYFFGKPMPAAEISRRLAASSDASLAST